MAVVTTTRNVAYDRRATTETIDINVNLNHPGAHMTDRENNGRDDDEYRNANANNNVRRPSTFFDRRSHRHGVDDHILDIEPKNDEKSSEHDKQNMASAVHPKPLSTYPSLQYALENSDLVALFFGASWSTMSNNLSRELHQYFDSDGMLLPPKEGGNGPPPSYDYSHYPLSIVYISSDADQATLDDTVRPNWITVPFDSPDRQRLKKQFHVGAKKELEELDMKANQRRFDIPTLVVVDSESHSVITTNGAEDLHEFGALALDHWVDILDVIKAMEERYADAPPNLERSGSSHEQNIAAT